MGPRRGSVRARGDRRAALAAGGDKVVCLDGDIGLRNLDDWRAGLSEIARVLRPGGRLGVLEFFRAESAGSRAVHGLYNRLMLPVLGRLLSPDPEAYRYLVESMERFASLPEFLEGSRRAGFAAARGETLFPGVCGLVLAGRAG